MLGATVNERVSSEGGTPVAGQLGWKAVASAGPWRAATTLPVRGSAARGSTSRPASRIMPAQDPKTGIPEATGVQRVGQAEDLGQLPDRGGLTAG
jgi:hypothetical protein